MTDVGIDASLADETQFGEPAEQLRTDSGPLPDEHQCFDVFQPCCEFIEIADVVGEDGDVMVVELAEAGQTGRTCDKCLHLAVSER